MSLDPAHPHRPISPASSGRSSPVNSKARVGVEDDKNYRRYASAVERALSLFDTALQDWADYIPFLGRLHKALQFRPPGVADIPHKLLVAKRLAQCLNPGLPSGVHQKTIELYTLVFSILGTSGLAKDLPIYLPGLSSTLTFASLSVRPAFLSLFEDQVLALDSFILRPALKAIILALLPGLEEEMSEEVERTHTILNRFKVAVGRYPERGMHDQDISSEMYFWQCLFLASINSTSRRQGALAYLMRNLPVLATSLGENQATSVEDQTELEIKHEGTLALAIKAVMSPEPGLLVRCFVVGLRDELILIQRGFLDLLVSHLPLSSPVFQDQVIPQDLERLVAAAVSVTSRREMSLNRRLWTWFLGPEESTGSNTANPKSVKIPAVDTNTTPTPFCEQKQSRYFRHFGSGPLVRSVMNMIKAESLAPSEKARPFRICLSLMDRWEIGDLVVSEVFIPLLESVLLYQKTAPTQEAFAEVQRSASVFFDGVDSSLIWGEIGKILVTALGEEAASEAAQSHLELIWFVVTKFNVKEEEMQMLHIPLVSLVLVVCLRESMQRSHHGPMADYTELYNAALRILVHLQEIVPDRAYTTERAPDRKSILLEDDVTSAFVSKEYMDRVRAFYESNRGSINRTSSPWDSGDIGRLLLQNVLIMVIQDLHYNPQADYFELELTLLNKIMRKVSASKSLDKDGILSAILQASDSTPSTSNSGVSLKSVTAIVASLETFCSILPSDFWLSSYKIRQVIPDLIHKAWLGLSPSKPNCNVEASRCVLRLHLISPLNQLVEATIVSICTSRTDGSEHVSQIEIGNARCFATLWAHSISPTNSSVQTLRSRSARRKRHKSEVLKAGTVYQMLLLGRPLLLLLDSLFDVRTQLFAFVINWLKSLPNIHVIVDFLMGCLRPNSVVALDTSERSRNGLIVPAQEPGDIEERLYYLQTIANLLTYVTDNTWAALATPMALPHQERTHEASIDQSRHNPTDPKGHEAPIHDQLARICLVILTERAGDQTGASLQASTLRQVAANVLQRLLEGPAFMSILQADTADAITKALSQSITRSDTVLQVALMDLVIVTLRAQLAVRENVSQPLHRAVVSGEALKGLPRLSYSTEISDQGDSTTGPPSPPPELLDCLLSGLSSPHAWPVLENWVQFLDDCLPFYAESAFQILMPLVDCLNKTIRSVFQLLRSTFEGSYQASTSAEPLLTLISLLNGLERSLARAHERLMQHEAGTLSIKTPEQTQGFFGNIVSGVFTPETNRTRNASANNRLTVLLCFKDAVHTCFEIWTWGDHGMDTLSRWPPNSASFSFTSVRLKNRLRRILEHLFDAEALECLETLIELWHKPPQGYKKEPSTAMMNLLHALEHSRPKNTIPAMFNAIYSRTNPNALDSGRKSSLTSDLSDTVVAGFLIAYMESLEDDAMDEIWSDCMTFLRDVLGNPLPHRQTLPRLLEFTAILGQKVDNTNFGEQRGMRRDLGDLFVRLLAATFTIKPLSFASEPPITSGKVGSGKPRDVDPSLHSNGDDIVTILARSIPRISRILAETDCMAAACSTISTQILVPTLRSKGFPHNVTNSTLEILYFMSRVPEALKVWRKDVGEAFNDPRFFSSSSLPLAHEGWIPVLRQWALLDKNRMPDLLSRISSPTSAGIMFGVGASSARLEADRKTQLNLRRLALLVIVGADDSFVGNLNVIQEKLSELMSATATSSPSSAVRAEIYMLLRALLLKTSSVNLVPFWPTINSELYEAVSSLFPGQQRDNHSLNSVLQACKLLDTLLVLGPDDFQLQEWIYITDTIDAVYRPSNWEPVALVDELVEALDTHAGMHQTTPTPTVSGMTQTGTRRPLLGPDMIRGVPTADILDRVLRPFFRQLSITAFESIYSMEVADPKACHDNLLADIFDDSTIA